MVRCPAELSIVGGLTRSIWEFPKIGDPDIAPQIVGFLL